MQGHHPTHRADKRLPLGVLESTPSRFRSIVLERSYSVAIITMMRIFQCAFLIAATSVGAQTPADYLGGADRHYLAMEADSALAGYEQALEAIRDFMRRSGKPRGRLWTSALISPMKKGQGSFHAC